MRLFITLITLSLSLTLFSQNYGSKIDPSNGFSQKLKEASSKTNTIVCNFDQTKNMAVLAKPNISKGMFFYQKEQNICLEYTSPEGNLIVMSGGKFKIITDGKKSVVDMKANPMMPQMGSMLSGCMTGNLELFGNESNTEYFETSSCYTVLITPTNKRVKKYLQNIVLVFDKNDMTLNSMLMQENTTDYTKYDFHKKKLNSEIETDKFKI